MYFFFAAFTHQSNILIEHTAMLVKKLSIIRWSAYHAAVKPVKGKFDECVAAIEPAVSVD